MELERTQHVRAYLFDEQGEEVSHRAPPDWAIRVAAGGPRMPRDGFIIPAPPMQRDSRASSDGKHRYTLVMGLPPGPRVFIGPRGMPIPALVILVISSGIVCYFLSWYLTKPIVRLRAATRQLAAGDLSARSGAPMTSRRDEVAGLMRDFDAMAERLETLVNAQSRLLNDISHELRSPLARLNVALGLARQRANVESADMLERIELEASRLNELIGRILTLARLEDGEQRVPQTPVPLDEIVSNVAEDAEFEAQERHCHVHVVIPESDWGVCGQCFAAAQRRGKRCAQCHPLHPGRHSGRDRIGPRRAGIRVQKRCSRSATADREFRPIVWENFSSPSTGSTMPEAALPAAWAWDWPSRREPFDSTAVGFRPTIVSRAGCE